MRSALSQSPVGGRTVVRWPPRSAARGALMEPGTRASASYLCGEDGRLARDEEFAAFVAARYRALVRTGLLLTGDIGHAEDLTQAALIRTYLAWGRLREPENAEAYVRRTLVRLAERARRRRWTGEVAAERMPEPSATAVGTGPEDLALDVRAALAALPVGQRAVLVLRYLDDQSEAETARLLGIALGTVKSRAARGLASLRNAGLLDREGGRHER
jgi:RNA polymerase sigma-70 factor (sigma-E family)